jgi:hypothetical protein
MTGFYHGGNNVHTPEWESKLIKGCKATKNDIYSFFVQNTSTTIRADPASMASNPAAFVFVGVGTRVVTVSVVVGVAEDTGSVVIVGRGVFWEVVGIGVEIVVTFVVRVVTFVVGVLVSWVGFVVGTFPRIRGF